MINKSREKTKIIRLKKKEQEKNDRWRVARGNDKRNLFPEGVAPSKELRERRGKSLTGDSREGLQVRKRGQGNSVRLASSLIKVRREIDRVDEEILALLERRFTLAISTVKSKSRLRDKEREKAIIAGLRNKVACSPYLTLPFVKNIYGLIFDQSLALEKRHLKEMATKRKNNRRKRP